MDKEVKKHIAAVRVSNVVGLLARKTWNVLLLNAYDDLLKKPFFYIEFSILFDALDYKGRNFEAFEDALDKLKDTDVIWDIGGGAEAKGIWIKDLAKTKMIAGYSIKNGILRYEFSNTLKEYLYNPQFYHVINLSQQNKFKSSFSLALWENVSGYVDVGSTGINPLMEWREKLGALAKTYNRYAYFKNKLLNKVVDEVNRVSTIEVVLVEEKKGRKVLGIGFDVKSKVLSSVSVPELMEKVKETDEYKKMISLKMPKIKVLTFFQEYGLEYITEKIKLLEERQKENNIKNPSAYLTGAIKEDWKIKIIESGIDDLENNQVIKSLNLLGIKGKSALKLLEKHGEEKIKEKLEVLEEAQAIKELKTPSGFLIKALEEDYKSKKTIEQEQENEKKKKQEEKRRREQLKKDFEKEQRKTIEESIKNLPEIIMNNLVSQYEETESFKRGIEIEAIANSYKKNGIHTGWGKASFNSFIKDNLLPEEYKTFEKWLKFKNITL